MKRIGQKEIARQLGISQAAVSGVLNGNPSIRISEENRKRILQAAEANNYKPNLLANAVFNRPTKTVGVLYQGGYGQLGVRKLHAVVSSLTQEGFLPLVYDLLLDVKGDQQCQLLCDLKVQGVIVINAGYPFVYEVFPQHLKGKVNVVSIDSPWDPGIVNLYSDRQQGFASLTRHLLNVGHRKIAILSNRTPSIAVDSPYTSSYGLIHGVTEVLAAAGLKPEAVELSDETNSEPSLSNDPYYAGTAGMRRLLDRGCKPDAVICLNDARAIGAMHECARRGIRIPEDMALVGYNDDLQARYAATPLTTIAPPVEQLAALAVRRVMEMDFPAPKVPVEEPPVILPCELVIRASCGANLVPTHPPSHQQP